MITVLCVLRSGGEYSPKHAARLFDQFLHRAPGDAHFLCLTDTVEEVQALGVPASALPDPWPGWWSKICALSLAGPCLYLDLDVTIVRDLDPLLEVSRETSFCVCANFWVHDPHKINSSVMAWSGDVSHVYESFAGAPDAHMSVYKDREKWGDQAFIADFSGGYETWQQRLPGAVVSFKRGVLRGENLADMVVCVSHGSPKPWEPGGADGWLAKRGYSSQA